MRHLIPFLLMVFIFSGCAEYRFRWKNYQGDRTKVQMDADWKDCYEHSSRAAFGECIKKKGYYSEGYYEE